jgi:hypothetical protein
LKKSQEKFGDTSFSYALANDAMGAWFVQHSKFNEARQYFQIAADLDDDLMGAHEPLMSRLALAMTDAKIGDACWASSDAEKLVAKIQNVYGNDTPYLLMPYEMHGLFLMQCSQREKDRAWASLDLFNTLAKKLVDQGKISADMVKGMKATNAAIYMKLGIGS